MKARIIFFAVLLSSGLVGFGQTTLGPNVWLGTAYGLPGDWQNPANWSHGDVPTDMDVVLIPALENKGKAIYPRIDTEVEIAQLIINPGAHLVITSEGVLVVEYLSEQADRTAQKIQNEGVLVFKFAAAPSPMEAPSSRIGMVIDRR